MKQFEDEPTVELALGDVDLKLLGTAHVSRASVEAVKREIDLGSYDAIALELCSNRYQSIVDPEALGRLNLFEVIRTRKAPVVTAMLAMGALQQRIADQFDLDPGAEMRAAIDYARERSLKVHLIDRDIGTTLRRVYQAIPWWKRLHVFAGLFVSVLVDEKISEKEIEALKKGDVLENAFAQFSDQMGTIYLPLIDERDQFMAAKLLDLSEGYSGRVLAVVGAGHLKGIERYISQGIESRKEVIRQLEAIPTTRNWGKKVLWVIVLLIIAGFGIGFSKSPELGVRLVTEWVLINGGLAALGVSIAGGHPITILSGFFGAPLTSLNPTVGAGMVAGLVEAWIRKPTVSDFRDLRRDTAKFSGWRRNRVARTLLVFFFATLGSAIGTYVAGFRIFDHLVSG